MALPPGADAHPMEAAEALEAGHGDADLELLEADGALGRVDAVLLGGRVREHAGAAGGHGRQGRAAAACASCIPGAGAGRGGDAPIIRAVRRDADTNVRLAQGLKVGEGARRKLAVTHGALVFLGDLGRRGRERRQAAIDARGWPGF